MENIPLEIYGAWLYETKGIPVGEKVPPNEWELITWIPGEFESLADVPSDLREKHVEGTALCLMHGGTATVYRGGEN